MFDLLHFIVPHAFAAGATAMPPPSCMSFFTTGMGYPGQGFICVADYIGMLTQFFAAGAATWCMIYLIVNGIRYMVGPAFPGGSSDQAKKGISTALTGLVLSLLTYIIIDTFIALLTQ